MFEPKCYTLINKMYNPCEDIRNNREKIREWIDKVDETAYDSVFDNIEKYIDDSEFPVIDIPWYLETVEGWKLIAHRKKLEKDYPREFKKVLSEEKRELREMAKMSKEDHKNSIITP
jgi:hypothetical protein